MMHKHPRSSLLRASVTALALYGLACAQAAVQEEHAERKYAVHAEPNQSLREALNAATLILVNGKRFHGYTRWYVRWQFQWAPDPQGRCRITQVKTRLTTEVQLPDLRRGTEAQQARFDRYLPALSQHEQGHVQVGRDAAQAIDRAIADMPAASDCATLERNANILGQALLQEHVEREKQFDVTTGHGATQGALLD